MIFLSLWVYHFAAPSSDRYGLLLDSVPVPGGKCDRSSVHLSMRFFDSETA